MIRVSELAGSLTLRVTAAFLAAAYLVMVALLGGLFLFTVHLPLEDVRSRVRSEAEALSRIDAAGGTEATVRALVARRARPEAAKSFDALIDDGRAITSNLPSWPARPARWHRIEADVYLDGDEVDYESLTREIRLPAGQRLLVGRDIEVLSDRAEFLVSALAWAALAVTILGLGGGLLLSRIVGSRLARVNATALKVMEGQFGERIATSGAGDDFDRLGVTLNAMLDRIEELVASVSRISDNIAHELRTPLTRLRTTLDELATEAPAGKRKLAGRALDEAGRLQHVFDALLRIARIETGRHQLNPVPVGLNALVADAAEFYRPEAESRDQAMEVESFPQELFVRADRDLLFQAVANLLDNAVKFTPRGGRIDLSVEVRRERPAIVVRDAGRGVSPAALDRITERFYRAEGTERVEGTGLGLSLVAAVARAHRADLDFTSDNTGFEAVFLFQPASESMRSM